MSTDTHDRPPHECGFTIEGPPSAGGRGLPTWRKSCKRKVHDGHRYCWQHRPLTDRTPLASMFGGRS